MFELHVIRFWLHLNGFFDVELAHLSVVECVCVCVYHKAGALYALYPYESGAWAYE